MDVSIHFNEVIAFFKSVWKLGIIGRERWQYWNLFFWTLFHYPRKFAMAITLSIYGYHFRTISELHIFEHRNAGAAIPIGTQKGQLASVN
jgi:hypothetical protein